MAAEARRPLLARFASAYGCALRRNALLQPLVSAALATAADVTAQSAEAVALSELDWRRTTAFSAFGGLYSGYFIPRWFAFASSVVHRHLSGRPRLVQAAAKVALDMGLQAPFSYMPAFFIGTGLWRGKSLDEAVGTLRERWVESVAGAWSVFGPAQMINFLMVPPELRVVYANTVAFGWNVGLSYYTNGGRSEARAEGQAEAEAGTCRETSPGESKRGNSSTAAAARAEGAPSAMAIGKRQERAMPLPTLFSSRGVRRAVQPQHDDTAAFAVR